MADEVVSDASPAMSVWRDPAPWLRIADLAVVVVALSLPWSTSLVSIFAVIWIVTLAPAIEPVPFLRVLKRPICALPAGILALALVGMLWSDAPWHARFYAVGPTAKLFVFPLVIYHFERSGRAKWIFGAFLISCTALMCMSWIVAFHPHLALKPDAEYGIPVKNYIDQSQEFALCALVMAWPILQRARRRQYGIALLYGAIATAFLVNMMYVTVSRTALVSMPIMLFIFALLHLNWRGISVVVMSALLLGGTLWLVAPNLRVKTLAAISEYKQYHDSNAASSVGLRLEFWKKSLAFFVAAPLVGHGTGSTRTLFEQAIVGRTGASAEVINNPHNQTLNVAVQWGVVGIVILYAMWWVHLLLFRGTGFYAWVGILVVTQNFVGSLFNSHLFDFTEGWMYVLGVGISGAMVLRSAEPAVCPRSERNSPREAT